MMQSNADVPCCGVTLAGLPRVLRRTVARAQIQAWSVDCARGSDRSGWVGPAGTGTEERIKIAKELLVLVAPAKTSSPRPP